jgi:3',5'-cyclic AMP phosphodiesterase CpdA
VSRRLTRRQAIARSSSAAGALLLAGCGFGGGGGPVATGSTLQGTWADPVGDGVLRRAPGEPLIARTELGRPAPSTGVLATIGHITDMHVLDASSPARVTFLDRLGTPFQSTFRPHETLTAHVLDGAVRAVRRLRAELVIHGGDLIDNAQSNELDRALAVLRGGRVDPGSGPRGYYGVQLASNPDPFYYRPDVDAPRYPGLLAAAVHPFASAGVPGSWYPVLGDHDVLVAGEIAPTPTTRALAVGNRALWELPSGLQVPPGVTLGGYTSPDGPPSPVLIDNFLAQALAGPTVEVPADPTRRELEVSEAVARLRSASGARGAGPRLDYHVDVGAKLRLIVLDLVRRDGGSGGLVAAGQPAWLADQLASAGERWVLIVTHQPLPSSEGGVGLLAILDAHPRVFAAIDGHTHRNRIVARPTAAGGYWLITTASLIDYPQQARALRVIATAGGGLAVQTWMLDHVVPGDLGRTARQLSYLDAQGGRPAGFAGGKLDRNVTLYRSAPAGA